MLAAAAAAALGLVILIEPYRRGSRPSSTPGATPAARASSCCRRRSHSASGGLLRVGLGESLQKAFYLPEAHTDMIAAVIGEELWMLGSPPRRPLGLFAYAGLRIAQVARDRYGKLLAAGLTSLILVQALVNLLAVFGSRCSPALPLPLVSYGNASMLAMLAAVRLLLNIPRWQRGSVASPSEGDARPRVVDVAPRVVIAAGVPRARVPALAVADALRAGGHGGHLHGRRGPSRGGAGAAMI